MPFRKALEGKLLQPGEKEYKPPSGTTMASWFNEDFGISSVNGHTTLFPHKTDACSVCCTFTVDLNSAKMSIQRHKQQKDDVIRAIAGSKLF